MDDAPSVAGYNRPGLLSGYGKQGKRRMPTKGGHSDEEIERLRKLAEKEKPLVPYGADLN